MNYVIKIILVSLLGTVSCGLLSAVCWYFVSYNYYTSNNGIINYSKEGGAAIGAAIGLICGCIGGLILSLTVAFSKLNRLAGFFVGACINGIAPLIFFIKLAEGDMQGFFDMPKDIWLSLLGQFIVGGIIGIIVSILANKQQNSLN